MGDALLQKQYTSRTLPVKLLNNYGDVPQYYVTDSHPAIISKETYEKAQALRRQRSSTQSVPINSPLRKKLICLECGKAFKRRVTKAGTICWTCYTHDRNRNACPTEPITEKMVTDSFAIMTNLLTFSTDTLLLPMTAQLRRLQERSILGNEDINALNKQILSFTDQLHAVSKLYNLDILDVETYREKSNALNAQLDEVQRKRKLLIEGTIKDDMLDKTEELISVLQDAAQSSASLVASGLFEQIVDKVLVDRNRKIVFCLINGLELTGAEGNKDGEE